MSDYVEIPFVHSTDPREAYSNGAPIFNTSIGEFRIAACDDNTDLSDYIFRAGVLRVNDAYYIHTWTNYSGSWSPMYAIINPALSFYKTVEGAYPDRLGRVSGYINVLPISLPYSADFVPTVFDNTAELFRAISADTDPPSSDSGIVVTCVGIPLAPDTNGVIVYCTGQLLNPYAPGGNAEPGGGGGQFDNPTDPIQLPDLPTHGVTDFIKLWNPSNADMVRLTELLFTGNVFTQTIRDLIGQPIDYIVSLGIVPVPLSIGSVSTPFVLAHQNAGFNMYGVAQQYMRWSCGSVKVPTYWNSFLDFEPHTSIQLYLPFIGFRDVLPSDVVGKTVTITYHLDVFTGSCVAYVANEDTILYQHNGTCLSPIPFGAEQMQNLVSGFVGLLGSAATAGAVLTGGFAAGIAKSILAGSAVGAASSALSLPEHKTQHGGNAGSTVGLLSSRKPYFVLNRPRQAVASSQGTYSGFATWYTVESFGQLDGYTQIAECHLHDIPATDWELQEIERLLKEGVIF